MLTCLWLALLLTEPIELKGKPAEGFTYDRFRQARSVWQKACAAHGVDPAATNAQRWLCSEFDIQIELEGHYATPWTTRDIPLTASQALREDGLAFWQKVERTRRGKTEYEEVALVAATARFRDYGQSDWNDVQEADKGDSWKEWRRDLDLREPQRLLARIAAHLPRLQWLGDSPHEPRLTVLSLSEDDGTVRSLFFDKETGLLARIETLFHHHGFGDQLDVIRFDDYQAVDNGKVPFKLTERRYSGGVGIITHWQRQEAKYQRDQPQVHQSIWGGEAAIPAVNEGLSWRDLGQGVYSVAVAEHEARVFVVAFNDHSVVLDAVGDSRSTEQLLELVSQKLPGQPVTKVVISHFHPFYTWGIRPYVQRGVEIITTPTVMPYLQQLTGNAHALMPDRLFFDPQPLNITHVTDRLVLEDERNRLEIYDIGEHSNHTPEYLVTYFPKLKLLIQGDLLWMRPDRPRHRASSRGKGLYTAIQERNLDVVTIGTTINHENFLNWIPMATLAHAVAGGNSDFGKTAGRSESITPIHRTWPLGPATAKQQSQKNNLPVSGSANGRKP